MTKEVTIQTALAGSLLQIGEVDAASVERMIESNSVGARIKQLRLKRSMGLVELGSKTGLSASFLSQLETGRVVPTLRNHRWTKATALVLLLVVSAQAFGQTLLLKDGRKLEGKFAELASIDENPLTT